MKKLMFSKCFMTHSVDVVYQKNGVKLSYFSEKSFRLRMENDVHNVAQRL
jgi:hypothetical protein